MWKIIIQVLTTVFKDSKKLEAFVDLLNKAKIYKNKITSTARDIQRWSDPRNIPSLIKKGYLKDLQNFYNEEARNAKQGLRTENKALNEELKKLEQENKKENEEQYKKDNEQDDNYWHNLRSSWLYAGQFQLTNKFEQIGNLTLIMYPKNAKRPKFYGPYTYPSVPRSVWLTLKNAPANAGTLFWKFWLQAWLPSMIRKYVRKHLPRELKEKYPKGTKDLIVKTSKELQKTKNYILNLQRNFTRTIGSDKNRSVKQIGSLKWKAQQRARTNALKRLYNKPISNMRYYDIKQQIWENKQAIKNITPRKVQSTPAIVKKVRKAKRTIESIRSKANKFR